MAYKITKQMFLAALENSIGTRKDVANRLDVTHTSVTRFLNTHPDMMAEFEKKRMESVDKAEHVLFEQLDWYDEDHQSQGENIKQKAALAILKNLGKSRGWTEKQEIEHSGEVKMSITKEEYEKLMEALDE